MILEVAGLSHGYSQPGGGRVEVLRELELRVPRGDTVAIVGESGSGKSTLLSLLCGLEKPEAGVLRIDGQALTELSEEALTQFRAARIGIVFQSYHLMGGLTALENVALPLELLRMPRPRERARELLAEVGLAAREHHLPSQLSGGECQRVAIARAVVTAPAIMLADEPSGSLDTRTGAKVMDVLFQLVERHGTTLVLVTHSEPLASRCKRRLRLADGRLGEEA